MGRARAVTPVSSIAKAARSSSDMAAALGEDRDSELHRALDAVVDIAADRLATLDRTNGEAR